MCASYMRGDYKYEKVSKWGVLDMFIGSLVGLRR